MRPADDVRHVLHSWHGANCLLYVMVLYRLAPSNSPRTLRLVGFAAAYTFAMALGTAVLIAGMY